MSTCLKGINFMLLKEMQELVYYQITVRIFFHFSFSSTSVSLMNTTLTTPHHNLYYTVN